MDRFQQRRTAEIYFSQSENPSSSGKDNVHSNCASSSSLSSFESHCEAALDSIDISTKLDEIGQILENEYRPDHNQRIEHRPKKRVRTESNESDKEDLRTFGSYGPDESSSHSFERCHSRGSSKNYSSDVSFKEDRKYVEDCNSSNESNDSSRSEIRVKEKRKKKKQKHTHSSKESGHKRHKSKHHKSKKSSKRLHHKHSVNETEKIYIRNLKRERDSDESEKHAKLPKISDQIMDSNESGTESAELPNLAYWREICKSSNNNSDNYSEANLDVTGDTGTFSLGTQKMSIKTEPEDTVNTSDNFEDVRPLTSDDQEILIKTEPLKSDDQEISIKTEPLTSDDPEIQIKTEPVDVLDNIEVLEPPVNNNIHKFVKCEETSERAFIECTDKHTMKKVSTLKEYTKRWLSETSKNEGNTFKDLCSVMQMMNMEIWKDDKYPEIYAWEVNIRRLFVSEYTKLDVQEFTSNVHENMRDYPDLSDFFLYSKKSMNV
nr:cytoplasmic dynein 2 intermediate chain 1-like isoform X2 [Procambarus clarkii]